MMSQLDPELAELRRRIRHSAAHVMADVVATMFPESDCLSLISIDWPILKSRRADDSPARATLNAPVDA